MSRRRRRRAVPSAAWAVAGLLAAAPAAAEPAPALEAFLARWRALANLDPQLVAVLGRLADPADPAVPVERVARLEVPPAPLGAAPAAAGGRAWPAADAQRLPRAAGERALRFALPAAAAVRAPAPGRVVFADRVAALGLVLITAHGDKYHSVLAGLGAVDVGIGTRVAAGERVGRMAERIDSGLELHLELRHHGRPVDPLPWLGVATGGDGPS